MADSLKELERLLAKATRGPWIADKHEIRHPDGPEKWGIPGGPQERANCAAIVALRNAAPSLIAKAREVEGLRAEVAKYRERWAMIDQLRGAEGCSVEIIHDNPDPGASNCAIYVTDNFGEDYSTYYGDTVDDCLRQAVASLNEGKPK